METLRILGVFFYEYANFFKDFSEGVMFLRVFEKMRVWADKQLANFSETGIGWYTY